MKRRSFTHSLISAAAGAALLTGFVTSAQAEGLSNRPIRIVVPFGAGGVADVTARVVAQQLSTQLGQPVVIDNKPSAGGIVAAIPWPSPRQTATPCSSCPTAAP